jgi:hypothetical protein
MNPVQEKKIHTILLSGYHLSCVGWKGKKGYQQSVLQLTREAISQKMEQVVILIQPFPGNYLQKVPYC